MADEQTPAELTRWTIHGERLVDDTRKLNVSIAHVELPDGVHFEQWVLRMPRAVMTLVLNDEATHVLMIYRHRWVPDRWTWELPGGYLDPDEDPARCAEREAVEETGWKPRGVRLLTTFQPLTGTADFENLIYVAEGAEHTGEAPDVNEAERVGWIPLDRVKTMIEDGRIIGAAAQIGLLHVLAFR
ncbi:NUDIX hydrolase [Saccharothrix violaceirubra]|uniref:8-oxo-dGTP pyrophosphatase MutT (NUDIX family) n=1 Tax=Saccharothrix violaceirubra TaxID=413306 RepID=A0A7W7T355_9PSEU|nr:NUDIX hydrolase [Saccharothrix violaceirubra]MBB4965142.1 8-oxo-dGTP pyrophosphatase MutT (NUDIX family) [Saccharothrix violaceirubra]